MGFSLVKTMVPVKGLPDVVRAVLRSVDYNRPDIAVEPRESLHLPKAFGDGYQAFAVFFNLATGERRDLVGSWGGPSVNDPTNRLETDHEAHTIPPNFAVICGQRGGGRPVSASLIVRPDGVAPLLPAVAEVTVREGKILSAVKSYTSAYRKATFQSMGVTDDEITSLVGRGLLTRNKAGAVGITTAGKNAAQRILAP